MAERLPVERPAPGPLECYLSLIDPVLVSRAQRQAIRDYTVALLGPRDRNKTLTALAGAEPWVGAQHREVQRFQWFLSESPWDHEAVNDRRVELLLADPATAPHEGGVLVLDDSGDRKAGHATAFVARQYIGSRGKIEDGIVAVTTGFADARVYYPLHTVPYRPASTLPGGRSDPEFATKPALAASLVSRAVAAGVVFRAVVADCEYGPGKGRALVDALDNTGVPFVVAVQPNQPVDRAEDPIVTPAQLAAAQSFTPSRPGRWHRFTRVFRDGHTERWWATDIAHGPYGPNRDRRLVVATTDPVTLPLAGTRYLVTNLPRRVRHGRHRPATLAEIVRLYSLRNWIEQEYKQVKHELGWADFQVRGPVAIQRHWALVNLAFTAALTQGQDNGKTADSTTPSRPNLDTWPTRLRQIRSWLVPFTELHRIIRSGALDTVPGAIERLLTRLATGNGIYLYLPP